MKKIIILIAIMCCFGWCNCKLVKIFEDIDYDKTFRFKCETPIEYTNENDIDSTTYSVTTSFVVINTQQCNYHRNGDTHCINIETDYSICGDSRACIIDFINDKFDISIYEKNTSLSSDEAKTEAIKLWNKLKIYIPFKNNKINFPITKLKRK